MYIAINKNFTIRSLPYNTIIEILPSPRLIILQLDVHVGNIWLSAFYEAFCIYKYSLCIVEL